MKLNQTELAKAFGVKASTIARWCDDGMPALTRGGKGVKWEYDLTTCIKWRLHEERTRERDRHEGNASADIDFNYQRARHEKLKADRVELEILKDQKILIPADLLHKAVTKLMAQVKTNVSNLPARLASKLARTTDEKKVKKILADDIKKTINAIVDSPDLDPDDLANDET